MSITRAANAFYAQSGGVTAVINASACGLIEAARHNGLINKVLVGKNGILGGLHEALYDTSLESAEAIAALRHTPGGAFGSCRYKLKDPYKQQAEYQRLMDVFAAHDIRYFFYNGGGDSMDTANKIAQYAQTQNYPLTCIGIPKTIDNDLPITDNCPGFGSVAKYVAVSIREAGFDIASMAATSTKVFILEVMGRHAGWIAAAGGLAAEHPHEPPHLILFPEIAFDETAFLRRVDICVKRYGYCAIVASEGLRNAAGQFLADAGLQDPFGHTQLGGVAPVLAQCIKKNLGYKYHWALADYLQRSARHIASATDVDQAYALGKAALGFATEGHQSIMVTIERSQGTPYKWAIGHAPLSDVANVEKILPQHFITSDGFGITQDCRHYLSPLIQGEAYPPYNKGLPQYVRLKNKCVPTKLSPFIL